MATLYNSLRFSSDGTFPYLDVDYDVQGASNFAVIDKRVAGVFENSNLSFVMPFKSQGNFTFDVSFDDDNFSFVVGASGAKTNDSLYFSFIFDTKVPVSVVEDSTLVSEDTFVNYFSKLYSGSDAPPTVVDVLEKSASISRKLDDFLALSAPETLDVKPLFEHYFDGFSSAVYDGLYSRLVGVDSVSSSLKESLDEVLSVLRSADSSLGVLDYDVSRFNVLLQDFFDGKNNFLKDLGFDSLGCFSVGDVVKLPELPYTFEIKNCYLIKTSRDSSAHIFEIVSLSGSFPSRMYVLQNFISKVA